MKTFYIALTRLRKFYGLRFLGLLAFMLLLSITHNPGHAQVSGTGEGCVVGYWGVDADLYSGVVLYGKGVEPTSPPRSNDWFFGVAGRGTIEEGNSATLKTLLQGGGDPTYEQRMSYGILTVLPDANHPRGGQILIDGLFARDNFGGTGFRDPTSYLTASKNAEDPAIWDPGEANVLGKNDILDVAGHMFRDGITFVNSDLWFVGIFNMAEPGGTSYMDFEFFVREVSLVPRPAGGIMFTSGGPQLGHTAYVFENDGRIFKVGDFIFSVSLLSSGPVVETRLWVSREDWIKFGGPTMGSTPTFRWAGTYDGAFNNSPYGYAGILPLVEGQICGYVNSATVSGETPLAPPWGTKGTKTNSWGATYIERSIAEVAINITSFGMDHVSLSGEDPCFFPLNTFIVKTRASASFTAQLKDFAGPYGWGQPSFFVEVVPDPISCDNPVATVTAYPNRTDVTYRWYTDIGNILNIEPYDENNPEHVSAKGFVIANNDPCLNDFLTPCTDLYVVIGDPWQLLVDQPGTYSVQVTLPVDCPAQIVSGIVNVDNSKPFFDGPPTFSFTVPCNTNDGTITVSASGATKPYTFFLYKDDVLQTQVTKGLAESSHTFTGLTAGTYRVDVKGIYACIETTGPFTVPEPIPVVVNATITNVDCFGQKTGKIELSVSGGTPPLTYLWSTGNTSQNLLNIGAGSYTVSITDAYGCVTTGGPYTVSQPTKLTASIVKTDDPGNNGDGTAEVFPSGGTPAYTYLWSKTGDPGFVFQPSNTAKKVTNLGYGEYTVRVTDDKGCFTDVSVFIFAKEICYDGIDNSGNGLTDCDDPGCPVPPPGLTKPETPPCVNENVTYTAQKPAMPDGVDPSQYTFEWTLPGNVVLVSGDPAQDESITLYWTNTAGGQICVRGVINWPDNFKCYSTSTCIIIEVDDVPPQPGDIIINNN